MDPVTMFTIKAGFDIVSGIFGSRSAKKAAKEKYEIQKKGIKSHFRMMTEDLLYGYQNLMSGIANASASTGTVGGRPEIEKEEMSRFQLRNLRAGEQEAQAISEIKLDRKNSIKAADAFAVEKIGSALIDYGTNTAKKPSKSTGLTDQQVAAGMAAEMPAQYAGYNDNWSVSAEKLLSGGRKILAGRRHQR